VSQTTLLFLKLLITQQVSDSIESERKKLQYELIELADNPVLLKRRFRMLRQLAIYESQIIDKIYNFEFQTVDDYNNSIGKIKGEIAKVTARNG
jgi:hypothetical protein